MKHPWFSPLCCAILLSSCSRIAGGTPPHVEAVISVPPSPRSSVVIQSSGSTKNQQRKTKNSLLITVPFSPQAPSANWDQLHEEACEEMSMIMVVHYWKQLPLTRVQAEEEIQRLIAWEHDHGLPDDITAEQAARIAREYFGLHADVRTDVTAESITRELRAGRPVIVPAAGRDLGNPYFSGEGPWYHMLVITGFDDTRFITNDPGTKRGENYLYDQTVLLNAIHDWTGVKEEIASGTKAMVVIY